MTSFGWKRKIGSKISKSASNTFSVESAADEDEAITSGAVDWLTLEPNKRPMVLEDAPIKSDRLAQEGATLAETERYWEALRKWDQALQLTPDSSRLMEMKAQAYMALNEIHPALTAAERTVDLDPCWWVAYQTLGRTRLNLGEVRLAVKAFSRAVHLMPDQQDLWTDDLLWAVDLLRKKQTIEVEAVRIAEEQACTITELLEEEDLHSDDTVMKEDRHCNKLSGGMNFDLKEEGSEVTMYPDHAESSSGVLSESASASVVKKPHMKLKTLKGIPQNYVVMRDSNQ